MIKNVSIILYVSVSLITIGILAWFLIDCKKASCSGYEDTYNKPENKRDMCLCSGMGGKLCANRDKLIASYNDGYTEYQDLAFLQKNTGGPFWQSTDFDKY